MKKVNGDIIREKYVNALAELLSAEDVMRTGTGSVAFPVVADDGEEGWVEVVVKIPKWTDDDDGYAKAEEYRIAAEEKKEKAEEKARAKAEKIAKDKAKREKKKEDKTE